MTVRILQSAPFLCCFLVMQVTLQGEVCMSTSGESAVPLVDDGDGSQRYPVTIAQYRAFRRDGFLVMRNVVSEDEIAMLREHTEDLMQGRLPQQQGREMAGRDVTKDGATTAQGLEAPPVHLSATEKAQYFLRIHMLHRKLALHESFMLHPRVLDILEVIIGPDVLAMQTMLFLKPPGKPGQGWHQDSYYIPTMPDSLCGAWIAIDEADERNGGLWFAKGSGQEPIYPPCPEVSYGFGDKAVGDIQYVKGVSDPNDAANQLAAVADQYDQVLVHAMPGDVVFFNGHVLHRSKANWTTDRFRRAFVSHYCNARSYTPWGADTEPGAPATHALDEKTGMTNGSHILARGDTHLPFAKPRFGAPCAALSDPAARARYNRDVARRIAAMNNGLMGCAIQSLDALEEPEHPQQNAGGGY